MSVRSLLNMSSSPPFTVNDAYLRAVTGVDPATSHVRVRMSSPRPSAIMACACFMSAGVPL